LYLFLLAMMAGCSQPDPPTIPFYPALRNGDLDQIHRHVSYGADLDALAPDGRRPLHIAAESGRWVVVELLLKNGADIDAPDANGRSPLSAALLARDARIAELLVKQGAAFEADALLRDVTLAGISDRDVMDFLVRNDADINAVYPDGKTPLILAIENNDRLMAKMLVGRGADVNLADEAGRRPLKIAEGVGNEAIIRLLLRNGADAGTGP
jgi:ankyrin repeat protein